MPTRAPVNPPPSITPEQTARFQTMFARTPSFAAVLVGREHRFALVNPACEALVGGRALIALTAREALPELADQGFFELLDGVYADGEAHVGRATPFSLRSGDVVDQRRLDFVFQPIRDDKGRVAAIFVEGVDASAAHASAAALHDNEIRNRQILDGAIDYAIVATDLQCLITQWNKGAELTLGWTEAEMLGRPLAEIFTPEDRQAGRPDIEMRQALEIGRGTDERWHVRRSGERFWASGEMTTIRDGDDRAAGFVKVLRDRTVQHKAIQALARAEAWSRRAQEAGGVGLFSAQIDGETIETSTGFCRIFGLPEAPTHALADLKSLVLPEDREVVEPGEDGELGASVTYRIRRPDTGEVRWIARRAEVENDDEGRPTRLLGVVQDVTPQHVAQRALAESEAKFRAFTEAVPSQVWSATTDGRLDWVNRRVSEYLGFDPQILLRNGWESRLHPDDIPGAVAVWTRALATGEAYETEFRIQRADGAYRWHIVRALPLRDDAGSITMWVGANTDNEDQHAAREALSASNAALERRVEQRTQERDRAWKNSRDLQLVVDADGVVQSINAALRDILGREPETMVGRFMREFAHPDDRLASRQAIEEVKTLETPPTFENRLLHIDGTYRWISWVGVAQDGLIYASGRHVTAEHEAAAELAAAQEQLRQAQKLEAVGQLTGGVAHDFNNLLTIIRSSVDFLRRDDLAPSRRARYVDAISETVDRAAKLTGQLLAFARRQPLKPEVFEVGHRVRSVVDLVRPLVGSRIVIESRLSDEPMFIEADLSQFETALVNMAVNGRDAMDGEGLLVFSAWAVDHVPAIRGHVQADGPFVAVSVRDAGSGIDPANLATVFEPFFTTKAVGKGTGLGLSQVFGFAKQSGGEVDVESAPGEGSTFTLYLPRVRREPEPAAPEAQDDDAPRPDVPVCVLLVEDNEGVGQFASEMLTDLGYLTRWAGNAAEALALLAEDDLRFDVVFSDVVMPGMNGVELARTIRTRHPGLPVVLTSGYSTVLAEEGRYGFELLQKPYSVDALARVLRKVVVRPPPA